MDEKKEPAAGPGRSIRGTRLANFVQRLDHKLSAPEMFVLSSAQEAIWLREQTYPGLAIHNLGTFIDFCGPFSRESLRHALAVLLDRHDAMRMAIVADAGRPLGRVSTPRPIPFRVLDLRHVTPDRRAEERRQRCVEELRTTVPLDTPPLCRGLVLILDDTSHVVGLTIHHAIADGRSVTILRRELTELYEQARRGQIAPLPTLGATFTEHLGFQHERLSTPDYLQQMCHWRTTLADLPEPLLLPSDRPRGPVPGLAGSVWAFELPSHLLEDVAAIRREERVTSFVILMAAFVVLMFRRTGHRDVLVATPLFGRTSAAFNNVVGLFANTTVLRTRLPAGSTFRSLLHQVAGAIMAAQDNAEPEFERVIADVVKERRPGVFPLAQVAFQKAGREWLASGTHLRADTGASRADVTLILSDVESRLRGWIEYRAELFEERTIARLAAQYGRLLEAALREPDRLLSELPILPVEERAELLTAGRGPDIPIPPTPRGLCTLLESQARLNPDRLAVAFGEEGLTYRELNARANQIAHRLRIRGLGRERRVGLLLHRDLDLVVAVIGVLKCGAAYVPLDLEHPPERVAAMVADADVDLIVTAQSLADRVPPSIPTMSVDQAFDPTVESDVDPEVEISSHDLAYVLFTSGSTGRPKSVGIEHGAAVSFVHWARRVFNDAELAGVLFSTPLGFDASVFELFVTLAAGGTILGVSTALDLGRAPTRCPVTLINSVPSIMRQVLRLRSIPASVRTINLIGEPLPAALARDIYSLGHVSKLYNLYGPTETTTCSTFSLVPRQGAVDIGQPIDRTQVYVLEGDGALAAFGTEGRIFIGGDGVARGYLRSAELTTERFVPCPFRQGRMYDTGDRGVWQFDGTLQYRGRTDQQIKLHGIRVELPEIETALRRHPSVREVAVIQKDDGDGDQRLVAYVEPHGPGAMDGAALSTFLRAILPAALVPTAFVPVADWPRTANGKLDRRALRKLEPTSPPATLAESVPETDTMRSLARLWCEVLRVTSVQPRDDFFDLGGNSLLALELAYRINDTLGIVLQPMSIFQHSSLTAMTHAVEQQERASASPNIVVPLAPGGAAPPLFWIAGVTNEVLSYAGVSRHLAKDRTVYGIAADWTRVIGGEISVPKVADRCVSEIRAVRPNGPYHIGGWCQAIPLALEVTARLENAGETVGLVAALDYRPVTARRFVFQDAYRFVTNLPLWITDDGRHAAWSDLAGRFRSGLRRVGRRLRPRAASEPMSSSELLDRLGMWRLPERLVPMVRAHARAMRDATLRPVRSRVVLILPRTAPLFGPWRTETSPLKTASGRGFDVYHTPGSHSTMLSDQFAEAMADRLSACLNRADAEVQP